MDSINKYTTTIYEEVVNITYEYLGPAADRFVTRQIRSHLNKQPEKLQKKDLKDLIVWIKLAMSLISNDDKLVQKYIKDLQSLADNKVRKHLHAGKANSAD